MKGPRARNPSRFKKIWSRTRASPRTSPGKPAMTSERAASSTPPAATDSNRWMRPGRRRRRGRRGGRATARAVAKMAVRHRHRSKARTIRSRYRAQLFAEDIRGPLELTETEAVAAVVPSPVSIPEPISSEFSDAPQSAEPAAGPSEPPPPPPVERAPRRRASAADRAQAQNGASDAVEAVVPEPEPLPTEPAPKTFEVVNQPPEQPRRGWWKRLTE